MSNRRRPQPVAAHTPIRPTAKGDGNWPGHCLHEKDRSSKRGSFKIREYALRWVALAEVHGFYRKILSHLGWALRDRHLSFRRFGALLSCGVHTHGVPTRSDRAIGQYGKRKASQAPRDGDRGHPRTIGAGKHTHSGVVRSNIDFTNARGGLRKM